MSFKNFIAALLCLYTSIGFAQNITGTIKSQSGEPVAFANIYVLNSQQGAVADEDGSFTLNLNEGMHQLQFSAIGFASKLQKIVVASEMETIEIVLSENTETLGEVVVTANKREEDIVKVTTSITSLSAKKVEDTRTWGLSGLTALVPNYYYQELGIPFQQIQSIRGIQVFSENPAVSTYIDDVNSLDILGNGFAFTDIERIEVMRGPQGTLYGRNAMGGVINIYTKKPTNTTSGFAEASVGNLGLQRYSTGFKTPLINNKLFFGWNGLYQTQEGFMKNDTTGTGTNDGSANGQLVGGEKNLFGNMYVKWLPNKRWEFTLNLKAQRDWSDNSGFFVQQISDELAFSNPDVINLARIGKHERNILNSAMVAKYYADRFTLTAISAYQRVNLAFQDIASGSGIYHSFFDSEIGELLPPQEVYSQEIRINSQAKGKLQYTAGVFAFTQVGYEFSTNLAFELGPDFYSIFRNESNNYGLAGFGELSYQFTDKLKGAVGFRYDYENREATFNGFGDAVFTGGEFTKAVPDTTVSGSYSALSPKIALSYALNERSNLYISYNRGFRTGGVNAQRFPANINVSQTFDPEYSDNYEVGYKTFLANNKLSIGASAFLIQWQDLQFFNLVAPPFTYARENVGDAQSLGMELEVSAIPVKGLQVDGSFGLNQTEYKSFVLSRPAGDESISGNTLANAPGHTLFVGAQYEYTISKKLKAVVRGEVRNIGRFYTDIQNQIEQPSYTVINSRLGLAWDKYSLFFWGQNLNDERFLAFGQPDSSFGRGARIAPPRTFGATLSAKF